LVIDGNAAGRGMGANLVARAFCELALDFAALDRTAALAALARIELTIADALADFRLQNPEGTLAEYDDAFYAMLDTVSTLVEDARDAVQSPGKPA